MEIIKTIHAKKLTVKMDKYTLKKEKNYAKYVNKNLSEIIESYLDRISSSEQENNDDESLR